MKNIHEGVVFLVNLQAEAGIWNQQIILWSGGAVKELVPNPYDYDQILGRLNLIKHNTDEYFCKVH